MKTGAKSRADAALAFGLGAFFLFQLIASLRYPADAALFPRIVGTVGLIFAVAVGVAALRGRTVSHFRTDVLERRIAWLAIAAPIVYGIALWLLGYWIASIGTLIAFPLLIGFDRPLLVTITAVLTAAVFAVLLSYMQVRLPLGIVLNKLLAG
ncbi:MAG: tripartite tricarboxylate transporter TctB family protein [Vicinamibacterales bacterium]